MLKSEPANLPGFIKVMNLDDFKELPQKDTNQLEQLSKGNSEILKSVQCNRCNKECKGSWEYCSNCGYALKR